MNLKPTSIVIMAIACIVSTGCGDSSRDSRGRGTGKTVSQRGLTQEQIQRIRTPPPAGDTWTGESPVRFVEESRERGIDFVQTNGRSDERFYVEVVGSGAIFFDADRDGDADLYLLNQKKISGPAENPPTHSSFYLNDGKGQFTDATARSGLADGSYSIGVCGGDIDNDGDIDLYVTRFEGPNGLYLNNGDLTFTDIAAKAGVTGDSWTPSSCAFADFDGDGFLDLYVGNYVDCNRSHNPACIKKLKDGSSLRDYCGPGKFNPVPDRLYRNRGDGTFADVSVSSGIASARGKSLGVAIADPDADGDQDIFIACDRTASLYYENDGHGKFRERAMELGIALASNGFAEAGMGTAWGDYDNDGWFDLVKTNYEFEPNNLYHNMRGRSFEEKAEAAKLAGAWG
jgi:hypothetical protein